MSRFGIITLTLCCLFQPTPAAIAQDDDYEPIDSTSCLDCHEQSQHGSNFEHDLEHSARAIHIFSRGPRGSLL